MKMDVRATQTLGKYGALISISMQHTVIYSLNQSKNRAQKMCEMVRHLRRSPYPAPVIIMRKGPQA